MIKQVVLSSILVCTAGAALASSPMPQVTSSDSWFSSLISFFDNTPAIGSPKSSVVAPEIDPASTISGLTLLLGGVAVVVSTRRKTIARV